MQHLAIYLKPVLAFSSSLGNIWKFKDTHCYFQLFSLETKQEPETQAYNKNPASVCLVPEWWQTN